MDQVTPLLAFVNGPQTVWARLSLIAVHVHQTLLDGVGPVLLSRENERGHLDEPQRLPGVQVLDDVASLSRCVLGSCYSPGLRGHPATELGVVRAARPGQWRDVGSSPCCLNLSNRPSAASTEIPIG